MTCFFCGQIDIDYTHHCARNHRQIKPERMKTGRFLVYATVVFSVVMALVLWRVL